MKRSVFILFLVTLLSACTFSSSLKYEVTTLDGSEFTEDDLAKIDKGFIEVQEKERAGRPYSYYLSKNNRHWDTLTIQQTETGLEMLIFRLSKYLRDFSDGWIEAFEKGSKELIEGTTKKQVNIERVINET